jgi:hypothetical protein
MISLLSTVQNRFPNFEWRIDAMGDIIANINKKEDFKKDVIQTDFLVCIYKVYNCNIESELIGLTVYFSSILQIATFRSDGEINKVLDDFENWIKEVCQAYKMLQY